MKWQVWRAVSETAAYYEKDDKCYTGLEESLSEEQAQSIADARNETAIRYYWEVRPGLPDNPRLKQATREEHQE